MEVPDRFVPDTTIIWMDACACREI